MKVFRVLLSSIAVVALASACKQRGEVTDAEAAALADREKRLASRMAGFGDSVPDGPLARWVLPNELKEISGLAVTRSGQLLAHNDEQGRVFVIDPKRGVVTKQFTIGKGDLRGDFEAISVRGDEVFMLISNGTIYRFREGSDGEPVSYTMVDTKLGHECEFEGLGVAGNTALLVCKNVGKRGPKDQLVIYRWNLAGPSTQKPSMLTVPLPSLTGPNGWKSLHPSDMTIDPASGNYVIIASQEKALIEITPGGQVLRSGPLPEASEQAEGVAILKDGILAVSDEGNRSPPTITLYRWPISTGSLTTGSLSSAADSPR